MGRSWVSKDVDLAYRTGGNRRQKLGEKTCKKVQKWGTTGGKKIG